MNIKELERLIQKYYGYVADLEGSGVEVLELLFVRDKIQRALDGSAPEDSFPPDIYKLVHELDDSLWRERAIFLEVAGKEALQHARKRIRSSRSFWWWCLDELESVSEPSEGGCAAREATRATKTSQRQESNRLVTNAAGTAKAKTTALITPEEVDQATKKTLDYRPPGQ